MLCPKCRSYVSDNDILCPGCGALLSRAENHDEGVRAIRQGRRARSTPPAAESKPTGGRSGASRVYVDAGAKADPAETPLYADPEVFNADGTPLVSGYERGNRGMYGETTTQYTRLPYQSIRDKKNLGKRAINWAHVTIACVILLMLAIFGAYMYLTRTPGGQKIMARLGQDADSAALWEVGEEKLDTGDIVNAIAMFEAAREKDGEENVNVNGLLLLGSAYEAAGRVDDAEALYRHIYTDVVPGAPDAYRNVIRILLASDRAVEAGVLMQTAYEKTGVNSFRQQRSELLPQPPTVDLTAGYYNEVSKTINLSSAQGYDIYYTFDDNAELPAGGVLYTGPITLQENTFNLRAVTVSGELTSDPLTATYKVYMPSPQTPGYSLAPGTYERRQRIWLRPGKDNEKDEDITIYYTIDGSIPDIDSPIYTGEPFYLPGGRVYLRAVAVNGYGKASNMLEIYYKINAKPYPLTAYTVEDTANGLKLFSTTRETFQEKYGKGNAMEETWLEGIDSACQKYTYDWGYATMAKVSTGWVLADLYFTTSQFSGPRSTGIGDTEEYVVGKFRDMGQLESPSGNRGLYENDDGKGKIYKQQDGTRIIRYQTETADSHTWQLDYIVNTSGHVSAIRMLYIP